MKAAVGIGVSISGSFFTRLSEMNRKLFKANFFTKPDEGLCPIKIFIILGFFLGFGHQKARNRQKTIFQFHDHGHTDCKQSAASSKMFFHSQRSAIDDRTTFKVVPSFKIYTKLKTIKSPIGNKNFLSITFEFPRIFFAYSLLDGQLHHSQLHMTIKDSH